MSLKLAHINDGALWALLRRVHSPAHWLTLFHRFKYVQRVLRERSRVIRHLLHHTGLLMLLVDGRLEAFTAEVARPLHNPDHFFVALRIHNFFG